MQYFYNLLMSNDRKYVPEKKDLLKKIYPRINAAERKTLETYLPSIKENSPLE